MDLRLPPDAALVVLPLLIFLARLVDVSLSTIRIILVSRGMRKVAPVIGFFEVLIWLFAISQVMQHLDRWISYVAFAGGFAAGTWAGIWLENRMALGLLAVRIITPDDSTNLIERLRADRFGVTDFAARGISGNVRFIMTIIQRKDYPRLAEIIQETHPKAFISTSDVRSASEGFIPERSRRLG